MNQPTEQIETNKATVRRFIDEVWNHQDFSLLPELLTEDYRDHSFPAQVPPTRAGLELWVRNTSKAFRHQTTIESIVGEGDMVSLRIRFQVSHIGPWRSLEPTGKNVLVKGFRFFRLEGGRIAEQHALLDGEALYQELSNVYQGCILVDSDDAHNSKAPAHRGFEKYE